MSPRYSDASIEPSKSAEGAAAHSGVDLDTSRISAQLASLDNADATAPCGARLRGRSGERGALRAASTQQTRTAAKQLLYVARDRPLLEPEGEN